MVVPILKDLLKLLISFAIPFLYSFMSDKLGPAPITQEQFLSLFLYVIGGLIGGWQANNIVSNRAFMNNFGIFNGSKIRTSRIVLGVIFTVIYIAAISLTLKP